VYEREAEGGTLGRLSGTPPSTQAA
jgi:hypothetical protein